jgi:hypothetical protein
LEAQRERACARVGLSQAWAERLRGRSEAELVEDAERVLRALPGPAQLSARMRAREAMPASASEVSAWLRGAHELPRE